MLPHRAGPSSLRRSLRTLRSSRLARDLSTRATAVLSALDIPTAPVELEGVYDGTWKGSGEVIQSRCPTTGEVLARVKTASPEELRTALDKSREAFEMFRMVPGPQRGEIVRQIREGLFAKREAIGALVSLEMGKIRTEGVGEVQEFVDICDYAVGLSRMMNGRIIQSERPGHTILEVPNPLGVVAVLSAFNFPVAVYGWNLSLSMAAGNATIWKPSQTTPLCAIAVTKIVSAVLEKNGIPGAVAGLVIGDKDVGEAIVESEGVDMVSFTGSEAVGRQVGKKVQSRFGKVLLELGGNNASIIAPSADLNLALPATFFGAVGTAGQRCTSTRRLYLHKSISSQFLERLTKIYDSLLPGDPLHPATLLGPVHTTAAVDLYNQTVSTLSSHSSATVLTSHSGKPFSTSQLSSSESSEIDLSSGNFVRPALVQLSTGSPADPSVSSIWKTEKFVPVLCVAEYDKLEEVVEWNNAVPQGLSSSLWTRDVGEVGKWVGAGGSDCGIVNVNVGTSGAEIGAAFGGNKSTGWGRESGGDAWKQYVRWSACTINYSDKAPLAQGVDFSAIA